MTTLLIDGDLLIYQVASACETASMDWGDGIITPRIADVKEASGRLDDRLAGLKKDTRASKLVIALKGPGNFRLSIYPQYKSNRKNIVRPILLPALIEYAEQKYTTYKRPLLEGDDILGILATSKKIIPGDKLIWSQDKDLMTIPGKHLDEHFRIIEVSEEQADYRHMIQTLTGDASDGYAGCPKIGPVKAAKILDAVEREEMWRAIVVTYAAAGFGEDFALIMARVARICRVTDYDFKKKEPILWNPPARS